MADYKTINESRKLVKGIDYTIKNEVLIINEGVKIIPALAFSDLYYREAISSIVLPSTLVLIESYAFNNCGNIHSLVIPDSVKYMMDSAFRNCPIKELTIGKNVIYIGNRAFLNNDINTIKNNSVKIKLIGEEAFRYNFKLEKFDCNTNSENIYFYQQDAFYDTPIRESFKSFNISCINLDRTYGVGLGYYPSYVSCYDTRDNYTYENGVLKIKDGVQIIGNFKPLEDCISVEIPDSVVIIQSRAFYNIKTLKNIKMSNNIIAIGDCAFFGCNLENIPLKMPGTLCYMNLSAFKNIYSSNRILCPHNMTGLSEKVEGEYIMIYDSYYNDLTVVNEPENEIADIEELIEEDKELLGSLNLLPEIIEKNKMKNSIISNNHSLSLKKTLIDIIADPQYDEEKSILVVSKLLETKEIDLSDMNETINILFERRQLKTIYLLISYGYECTNNCMISRAIINNLFEMIDVLLLLKADINEIGPIEMYPLSIACTIGDYDLVKHLIEKGAALNIIDSKNNTPIDYAREYDQQQIVDLINSYNVVADSESEKDIDAINRLLSK